MTNLNDVEIEMCLNDNDAFKKCKTFYQKLNQSDPVTVSINEIPEFLGYLSISKTPLYITICDS